MLLLFSHSVIYDSLESVDCSTPGFPVLHRLLLKVMSIESLMPSNHLIVCHPLLLLPSIFPRIRVFSNESDLRVKWPKFWSFSFNISPSNEYSGLISFRIDWFGLLAVEGTLKSLLHRHILKASILQFSVFFYCPTHNHTRLLINHSFDYTDLRETYLLSILIINEFQEPEVANRWTSFFFFWEIDHWEKK